MLALNPISTEPKGVVVPDLVATELVVAIVLDPHATVSAVVVVPDPVATEPTNVVRDLVAPKEQHAVSTLVTIGHNDIFWKNT